MWAYRFERSSGVSVWRLPDLREGMPPTTGVEWGGSADHPRLRLVVKPGSPPVAIRLAIPGIVPVEALHLRFQMTSHGLVRGTETWADGRFMIEWQSPEGEAGIERDAVCSTRDDKQGRMENLVIPAPKLRSIPVLRLEHLGRSGDFELSELEITAVEERPLWKIGRWFLAGGWLAWAAFCIRSWPGISRGRALAAAAICVLLGVNFVIPGPWKIQRAIVPEFQLGSQSKGLPPQTRESPSSKNAAPPPALTSGAVATLGKIPDQGSLPLRVKHAISKARPLLHALLLFAPMMAFLLLLGIRPALFLALTLAASIELAQFAFGYGFGWDDVFDLVNDGVGITLAVLFYKRIHAEWSPRAILKWFTS